MPAIETGGEPKSPVGRIRVTQPRTSNSSASLATPTRCSSSDCHFSGSTFPGVCAQSSIAAEPPTKDNEPVPPQALRDSSSRIASGSEAIVGSERLFGKLPWYIIRSIVCSSATVVFGVFRPVVPENSASEGTKRAQGPWQQGCGRHSRPLLPHQQHHDDRRANHQFGEEADDAPLGVRNQLTNKSV